MFDASPLPIFIYERESFSFLDINPMAIEQYGYTRSEWLKMSIRDLLPASNIRTTLDDLAAMSEATFYHPDVLRHLRKNKTQICVDVLRYRIPFQGRQAILEIVRDVTAQLRKEEALRTVQRDLNEAQLIARLGSWVVDTATLEVRWSDQEYRNFGLEPRSISPSLDSFLLRVHPDDQKMVSDRVNRSLSTKESYECEHRVIWPDGSMHWMREQGAVIFDDNGRRPRLIGTTLDVTAQRYAEEKIKHLAYFDPETGFPNRISLHLALDKAFAECCMQHPIALLIVDLICLHDINYTFGRANGDLFMKESAVRIGRVTAPPNMVARLGNTEFAVVLFDASAYDAATKARHIMEALTTALPLAGSTFDMEARIGIAVAPGHGTNTDTILRKADVALFQAQQAGQSYAIYQASQDPYTPQRLALMGDFRRAIDNDELQLYCQPKAAIQSRQIVGAEALVRWQHPQFGMVSPEEFIHLIEQTDMIHLLTKFMLQTSLRQCYEWKQHGIHIPLAVNLSARNLTEPDLATNLTYLLQAWGADATSLGLEITESSLLTNPTTSITVLERLSQMGFRLFIDDFGTGYSSLNYLMKLPINVIKIDRAFTMNMGNNNGAAAIVKSTIELAHSLGMGVVAEGTASQEIWDALVSLGCDEAQGYFISPPMPAKDLLEWLPSSGYGYPDTMTTPL